MLNSKQLAAVDQATIEVQNITSWDLMERAATRATSQILNHLVDFQNTIHLFCGIGNNGGDGLAIAYHLHKKDFWVKVYKVEYAPKTSIDFDINAQRLQDETEIQIICINENTIPELDIANNDVLIDAVFGVGLNRKMPDFVSTLLSKLSSLDTYNIAIDVPSGLFVDQPTPYDAIVFRSDACFTFELPKLVFLLPETGKRITHWRRIPIGLDATAIEQQQSPYVFMKRSFAKKIYRHRERFSHKGTYGTALLVGGQWGMIGSILLASRAALRSGVGKLFVMLPADAFTNLHHFVPEAMAVLHTHKRNISYVENLIFNSMGIGMGMGTQEEAALAFRAYLEQSEQPALIDADGLNLLAENKEWLKLLPENSVLTPHPGELQRLLGNWKNDFNKLEKIKEFAKTHSLIIVAKDAYTCVCDGTHFYFNSTGNSGMATAGSGDILSGIITALLAQGYSPLQAAQLGVYVHGLAGDLALAQESVESLLASDILDYLGQAFKRIQN